MTTFYGSRGGLHVSRPTLHRPLEFAARPGSTSPGVSPFREPALGHDFGKLRVDSASPAMVQRGEEDQGVGGGSPSEYVDQGVAGAGADRTVEGPYVEPYDPATLAAMEAVAGDVAGMIAFPAKVGWDAARMAGYGLTGQTALARGAAVDVVSDVATKNPIVGAGTLGYDIGNMLLRGGGASSDMTPMSGDVVRAGMDALPDVAPDQPSVSGAGTSSALPTDIPPDAYPGPVCEQGESY